MKPSFVQLTCLSLATCLLAACGKGKFGGTDKERITEVRYEQAPANYTSDQKPDDEKATGDGETAKEPEIIVLGPGKDSDKDSNVSDDSDDEETRDREERDREERDRDERDREEREMRDREEREMREREEREMREREDREREEREHKDDEDKDEDEDDGYDYEDERDGDVRGGRAERRRMNDDDRRAYDSCSAAFGRSLPLGRDGSVRTIAANVSVLSSGVTLRDNRASSREELTIIYASVGVLSDTRWELLNPNGLYCVVANVNVLSKLTIFLEESAQLSDGIVSVNVLSSSNEATASIGVNVLSNVKVFRIRRN